MSANLENSQDSKRSVLIPIPKKGDAKESTNYQTIVLNSHASEFMLKILQARLQQYVKWELPNVQTGFKKGRGTRDSVFANIRWIIEKAREFQKNIYFCFIENTKAFDYVDYKNLWKIVKVIWNTILSVFWKTCMRVKKQQLELDMEQLTSFKLGKEYNSLYIVTLLI